MGFTVVLVQSSPEAGGTTEAVTRVAIISSQFYYPRSLVPTLVTTGVTCVSEEGTPLLAPVPLVEVRLTMGVCTLQSCCGLVPYIMMYVISDMAARAG